MDSVKASLFDIHHLSTHDGPGLRTVFFFKGCSLNCEWCQNPESIDFSNQVWHYSIHCIGCGICMEGCPQSALKRNDRGNIFIDYELCTGCGICTDICPGKALKNIGTAYTIDEAVKIVEKDKPFMSKATGGGITVSGGEPLMQADFLKELLKKSKHLQVHTAVDTCGNAKWESLEKVLPYTDLFLYDLKFIDSSKHREFTGSGNDLILDNLLKLTHYIRKHELDTAIWIRTPLIPGTTLTEKNIQEIGEFISEDMNGAVDRWELCSFNPLPLEKYDRLGIPWKYKDIPLLSKEESRLALQWAKTSAPHPEKVFVTGLTSK